MKWYTLLLTALLLAASLGGGLTAPVAAPAAEAEGGTAALPVAEPQLVAQAYILIDAATGRALCAKNADARMAPASTTKIMTCLLALESDKMGSTVTVPDSAAKAPADSTVVPVYPGEEMPFTDLIYGLMMKSGNDAANAIATLTAGSVSAFVDRMNARAEQLGMADTRFSNAHGYPEGGHYTTARDLAILTRAALRSGDFSAVVRRNTYTLHATARRGETAISRNYAILDQASEYYYPYAFGVKTGYASAAGQCYVGAAEKGGRTLIAVLLKSGQAKPDKWVDAKKLFEYGFAA